MKFRCVELQSVDSTNSYLASAPGGQDSPQVVYSWNQTAGRGRLGRQWMAVPGGTLAFSFKLPLLDTAPSASWLPLLAGHVMCEVVRAAGITAASVKWPNDVMVGHSKLAGILVEAQPDSYIVGIGINVTSGPKVVRGHTPTSLRELGWEPKNVVSEIIEPVCRGVSEAFTMNGTPEEVLTAWRKAVMTTLGTIGQQVEVGAQGDDMLQGFASGLATDGALLVSLVDTNEYITVHAGDVFHIERS